MVMSHSDSDQQRRLSPPRWFRSLVVLACVLLPATLSRGLLEFAAIRMAASQLEEPEGTVRTPNPAKAPWVRPGESFMMYVNPRLAHFAHRWKYLPLLVAVLSALALPLVVTRWKGLVPASLAIGIVMAWPWLMILVTPLVRE
jgi:hypothetical protein